MDVSNILNDLNDAQRQAVTSESQKLLVLAGAGSGKTKVLVHRIAWLIEALSNSTHSILAVTFTNKAAKEMQFRVSKLLNSNVKAQIQLEAEELNLIPKTGKLPL